jgi:hypothetical protein
MKHYSKGYVETGKARPQIETEKKHHSKTGAPAVDTTPDTTPSGPDVHHEGNFDPDGPDADRHEPQGPGKH